MPRRLAPLFLLALPLPVIGCLDQGHKTKVAPTPRCASGSGAPLTERAVTSVLRRHGFTVYRDVDSALCTSERVAFLTNVLFAGPHQNVPSHDEVSKREGDVSCGIGKGAVPPFRLKRNLNAPSASPVFKGDKATFHLANLGCVIYPDGDDPPAQVRRLDAAMVELERTLGS